MKKSSVASARISANAHRERGVALLAVLWAVTLLGLVALALSNSVQDEVRTATYRKEAAQAYAIACGGVDAAILAIVYPPPEKPETTPFWTWKQGQREGVVPFQGGRARLLIENESGKVDLNVASRGQLTRLFEARGLPINAAEQLATAISYWRAPEPPDDPDAQAIDQYYQRAGIHPRYGRFQSLEEVLNVRGMSREIFYGTVQVSRQGTLQQVYGVGDDLTVSSSATQVNVNYASEYALRSAPGVDRDTAEAIVQERKREPFRSVTEIGDRIAMVLPEEALPYLATGEGNAYSIISIGEITGSRVHRAVKALVRIDSQGFPRHRLIAWYDDAGSERE